MGTFIENQIMANKGTGDSEEDHFIIKEIIIENYVVLVKLTTDYRFIDILAIKIKKPDFPSYSSEDISIDVSHEYQD
nr:hypothetical protein [uncultured Methanoregula sp.]